MIKILLPYSKVTSIFIFESRKSSPSSIDMDVVKDYTESDLKIMKGYVNSAHKKLLLVITLMHNLIKTEGIFLVKIEWRVI